MLNLGLKFGRVFWGFLGVQTTMRETRVVAMAMLATHRTLGCGPILPTQSSRAEPRAGRTRAGERDCGANDPVSSSVRFAIDDWVTTTWIVMNNTVAPGVEPATV